MRGEGGEILRLNTTRRGGGPRFAPFTRTFRASGMTARGGRDAGSKRRRRFFSVSPMELVMRVERAMRGGSVTAKRRLPKSRDTALQEEKYICASRRPKQDRQTEVHAETTETPQRMQRRRGKEKTCRTENPFAPRPGWGKRHRRDGKAHRLKAWATPKAAGLPELSGQARPALQGQGAACCAPTNERENPW